MLNQQKKALSPDDLAPHSLVELRSIVTDYHGSWHHREKRETLIERICELSCIVQPTEKDNRINEQKASEMIKPVIVPPVKLTDADILAAVQPNVAFGLVVSFDDDGWNMRFRDKYDSGNMTMPLITVKRCADMLVRGTPPRCPACKLCGLETAFNDKTYVCINTACAKTDGLRETGIKHWD